MRNIAFSLTLIAALAGCTTPLQVLQGLGSMTVGVDYIQQSKRLCAQQNDPALRYQCEQQAQKEFQKFQKQTGEKP